MKRIWQSKKFRLILSLVIIASVVFGAIQFMAARERERGVPVVAQTHTSGLFAVAEKTDLLETISATGTVGTKDETEIFVESSQIVSNVVVEVGDVVTEGQVLIEYDMEASKKDLEKNLIEAQISLQNAKLSYQNLTLPLSESEKFSYESSITAAEKSITDANTNLANTDAKIALAQNDVQTAQNDLDSIGQLYEIGGISLEEYNKYITSRDNAQNSLDELLRTRESNLLSIKNAQQSLEEAQKKYDIAKNSVNEQSKQIQLQQQQNQIALAELNIEKINDKLGDLIEKSTSPLNGTVIAINTTNGATVTEEKSVLALSDLRHVVVTAGVSELDAPKLALGQEVSMYSDGIQGRTFEGVISYIAPTATTGTTSAGSETVVLIEVAVNNDDGILKPGYGMEMEITVADLKGVLAIPISSLQKDKETGNYYVYTVDEKMTLKKVFVTCGLFSDLLVEVTEGLSERDRVIESPTTEMHDGMTLDMESMPRRDGSGTQNARPGNNAMPGMGMPMGGSGGGGQQIRMRN